MITSKKKLAGIALIVLAIICAYIVFVMYLTKVVEFNQHHSGWFTLLPCILLLGVGLLLSSKISKCLIKESEDGNLKVQEESEESINDIAEDVYQRKIDRTTSQIKEILPLASSTETEKSALLSFQEQRNVILEEIYTNEHSLQELNSLLDSLVKSQKEELSGFLSGENKVFSIHPDLKSLLQELQELQESYALSLRSYCESYVYYVKVRGSNLPAFGEFNGGALSIIMHARQVSSCEQKWNEVRNIVLKMKEKVAIITNQISNLKVQQHVDDSFIDQCNEWIKIDLIAEYHGKIVIHLYNLKRCFRELNKIVQDITDLEENPITVNSDPDVTSCQNPQINK